MCDTVSDVLPAALGSIRGPVGLDGVYVIPSPFRNHSLKICPTVVHIPPTDCNGLSIYIVEPLQL